MKHLSFGEKSVRNKRRQRKRGSGKGQAEVKGRKAHVERTMDINGGDVGGGASGGAGVVSTTNDNDKNARLNVQQNRTEQGQGKR